MNLERQFSKEIAKDLRQETANRLKEVRKEPTNFSELDKEMKNKEDFAKKYDFYSEIKESFESIKKDIWGKIFRTEKYLEQKFYLDQVLKQKKESDINEIQKEYKKEFVELLKNCPLTLEEKEKYLSTESMEKMSLDDYLTLLKRLSGEAFFHVTRFGVRENTFMSTGGGHTLGKGEFINGLIPLLKDKYINSCTSSILSNNEKASDLINKELLKEFIEEGMSLDEIVDKFIGGYGTINFLDRESTHFSYGKDLHHMYGGEKDYKFYFYYPVEYIMQNDFYHSTREMQLTVGNGGYLNSSGTRQQYNDFEIFNFGKGVPIDAGILCITDNIRVDPETGSQYLLKNGIPFLDENGEYKKPKETISSKEYWEIYFTNHPELKPNKIIYGDFNTYGKEENEDLKKWADSKKIHKQDENKKLEFIEYHDNTRDLIKEIFREYIKKEFDK